ncbi:MAG: response regulator [Alphaproteobacteria bacterium]|nr:response regulator [Alphaproteobacteria bacterium]MCB9696146.1 response regulator [Alphaproteobacteria bacterium]
MRGRTTLVVAATEGAASRRVVRRGPAWIALILVVLIIGVVGLRRVPAGVDDLGGAWDATWTDADGQVHHAPIELPGLFARSGIPADTRVLAERTVRATGNASSVFLEAPLYAVTVTWDGRPLGAVGDPSAADGDRSSHSVFLSLPDDKPGSVHRLGLDLRGDYGKGGVTGRILMGPTSPLHQLASLGEVQRLALAIGLALLAALPLTVASRGAWRPAHLAYGLFATSLSVLALAQTDLALELLGTDAVLRLRRLSDPLVAPFGVLFVDALLRSTPSRAARWFCGIGMAVALVGAVAPASWMYVLEVCGDALFVPGFVAFVALAVRSVRERVPGSVFLAGAMVPVLWAVASEVALTHGLRSGGSHLLVAAIGFAVLLGAALVVRDAELSEQHERLVRGSLDAMVTVDRAGRIRDANPSARRMLHPVDEEDRFLLAVVEADQPLVRAHLDRALLRADRTEFHTPGGRVLESLATPLSDQLMMLTLRDISVRRQLDRGMLQAARAETMGVLLGGIAHDFNNMLSTLLAHLGLLKLKLPTPDQVDRISRMETTVDRASELTRRLLTIARGTGSELEATDLLPVLREAADLVEPTIPENVELTLDLPDELPPVLGAASDLEQVVVNLLVNARDAVTREGGHVRLAARPLMVGKASAGVVIAVDDDGPGVTEDRREQIFQPFVTDKPQGTGLGLAVARQILSDHHGRIWVEDRPGGGARFLLALRHADAVDQAPAPLPRGRRVLVVEDEDVLLDTYTQALRDAGYDVVGLSNSTEALHWLQTQVPDVLVTDVVMPGFHGLELARICHQLHPEVPVLFVSAFVPDASAMPEGVWSALNKPVRPARLVATVGRLRRKTERRNDGDDEITSVVYQFPELGDITAATVGL